MQRIQKIRIWILIIFTILWFAILLGRSDASTMSQSNNRSKSVVTSPPKTHKTEFFCDTVFDHYQWLNCYDMSDSLRAIYLAQLADLFADSLIKGTAARSDIFEYKMTKPIGLHDSFLVLQYHINHAPDYFSDVRIYRISASKAIFSLNHRSNSGFFHKIKDTFMDANFDGKTDWIIWYVYSTFGSMGYNPNGVVFTYNGKQWDKLFEGANLRVFPEIKHICTSGITPGSGVSLEVYKIQADTFYLLQSAKAKDFVHYDVDTREARNQWITEKFQDSTYADRIEEKVLRFLGYKVR